jgi:hypothetical protein
MEHVAADADGNNVIVQMQATAAAKAHCDGSRVCHVAQPALVRREWALHILHVCSWPAHAHVSVLQKPVRICIARVAAVAICHDNGTHAALDEMVEAIYLLLHQTAHLHTIVLSDETRVLCNVSQYPCNSTV